MPSEDQHTPYSTPTPAPTPRTQARGASPRGAARHPSEARPSSPDATGRLSADATGKLAGRTFARASHVRALDGLRALAIIAVVCYHAWPAQVPGGFLGVTVFFVLTGFLTTRSVWVERRRTGSFDLGRYVRRRIGRIAPAMLAMIFVAVVLSAILSPNLLVKVHGDALPSALFYSNWHYIANQVSYFQAAGLPSPLTHLWFTSLSMQFYLLWPPILLVLWRLVRRRRMLGNVLVVLALASTVLMALLFDPAVDTARVYYGLDTRLAELMVGAFLGVCYPMLRRGRDRVRPWEDGVSWVLITLFVLACLFVDGTSYLLFRGGFLVCAAGCALVVRAALSGETLVGRVLSLPPLTWLGRRSFSLFLWHYPLLRLMNPANRTTDLPWWGWLIEFAVIVLVSELSYHLFEVPAKAPAPNARVVTGAVTDQLRDMAAAKAGRARVAQAREKVGMLFSKVNPQTVRTASVVLGVSAALLVAVVPLDWDRMLAETTGSGGAAEQANVPAVEAAPAKPAAVAERVPENLDTTKWSYDAATGTCSARVLVIGDSVVAGVSPLLEEMLPNARIDAAVSRQFYTAPELYAEDVADGYDPDVVIVALGSNGAIRDDAMIQEVVDAVGGRPIYFVTVRNPYPIQDSNNEMLRANAATNANAGIIDWNGASEGHDDYIVADGTHPTAEGMEVYAKLIRQALVGV